MLGVDRWPRARLARQGLIAVLGGSAMDIGTPLPPGPIR